MSQNPDNGLRIVTIGGGTGQSTVLRGLKRLTRDITAIVPVSDDGGSSGRLRQDFRMPPPGDARNCLVALADGDPLVADLFNHRFNGDSSLDGHSLGNLLLAALYEQKGGFGESLAAAARLLDLAGRVVPVSDETGVALMGRTVTGQALSGESSVGNAPDPIERVWLEPEGARAAAAAVEAIGRAELVVIGPGSLYTSVIPCFMARGVGEAVAASRAPRVFVCNVATQAHETDGYGVAEHLNAFQAHAGVSMTHVLVNSNVEELPGKWGQTPVAPVQRIDGFGGSVVLADVVDESNRARHDPDKLAAAIADIAVSRSGEARKVLP